MPSLKVVVKALGATLLHQADSYLEMLVSERLKDYVSTKVKYQEPTEHSVGERIIRGRKWLPLRPWRKRSE